MFRTQSLLMATLLMTSAAAFAQDTPAPSPNAATSDPSSAGGAPNPASKPVSPSEVEGLPTTTPPPAAKQPPMTGQREPEPSSATTPRVEGTAPETAPE
jgi:hypothetical protein